MRREGEAITRVGCGKTVHHCLAAAEGLDAELIDLRSLKPLDTHTVLASVRKTGRLLCVTEASGLCGLGAELCALVSEQAWAQLKAPPAPRAGAAAALSGSLPQRSASATTR